MERKNIRIVMKFMVIIAVVILLIAVISFSNQLQSTRNNSQTYGRIKFFSQRVDKKNELENLIEKFEKKYPGIEVDMELIGSPGEYLTRKASVGELPDVTIVPYNIPKQKFPDYLLPIDDLGFTQDSFYNYENGLGLDENVYGLTTGLTFVCVIYNKNIFKEAGITTMPKTDDEFLDTCKKIKSIGKTPMAIGYKGEWIMSQWINNIPYLRQPDFESQVINDTEILGERSELYKDVKLLRKIVTEGYCEDDFKNYEWSQCKEDFINGKIGMIILSYDFINQFCDEGMERDDIGIFAVPESKIVVVGNDYLMGIAKTTKYPEASKTFLKYLFENDRYANTVNITSPLKESPKTRELMNELATFNIPIQFLLEKNDLVRLNEFYHKKVNSKFDWKVIQRYITTDNEQELIDTVNSEWELANSQ